ncbi:MAG: phosphatidate cytidylyltransferase [Trueperaceae bacterium]
MARDDDAPTRSPLRKLGVRVSSALAAFLAALAVVWAGLPLLAPVYLALSGVAIFEYAAMMRLRGVRVPRAGLLVMTLLTLPAAVPPGHPLAWPYGGMPAREVLLMGFLLALLAGAIRSPRRDALPGIAYGLLGYLWIPYAFSYVLTLRLSPDPQVGLMTLLLPLLAIVASDVGGWAIGSSLGRRPLAPVLSPGKTIEGALGGLALAALVVPLASWGGAALDLGPSLHPAAALAFALLVATVAMLGDLFESLIKRWAGVKDAGVFLPGHGGVLDRLDSNLFGLPAAFLLYQLIGWV